MSQRRQAILIGSSEFPAANERLPRLPSAERDVRALENVLRNPKLGGFTDVQVALDLPHYEILFRINRVMRDADRDDLILIYYSGHGLLDVEANLFLTTVNTDPTFIQTTAVPCTHIRALFGETKCRRIIVILDCCYSGAAKNLDMERMLDGKFHAVGESTIGGYAVGIVASSAADANSYAPLDGGESPMTAAMVEAIRTGQGDRDYNGVITLQELVDYTRDALRESGFSPPQFSLSGATGSLVMGRSSRDFLSPKNVHRIHEQIALTRQQRPDDCPECIFGRAEEILEQPEDVIREKHEALFQLLSDWASGGIGLDQLTDQWYQFDGTGLVATDKSSEGKELADQDRWTYIQQCRRSIHDLVSPSYILDCNYHFLDWNPMFDELLAKPMGLTRFRHAEDFILRLRNHRDIIERSRELFSNDVFPMVDIEDLEYDSPKYGLIRFKKIASQIASGSDRGGLLAWSVNLNITYAEKAEEMWRDLQERLNCEVNWSIYAKLYDRMLLKFEPYRELINTMVGLLGDAQLVADLGAGTGNATTELLRRESQRKVWALEANEDMIEHLRGKLQQMGSDELQRATVFKGDRSDSKFARV